MMPAGSVTTVSGAGEPLREPGASEGVPPAKHAPEYSGVVGFGEQQVFVERAEGERRVADLDFEHPEAR